MNTLNSSASSKSHFAAVKTTRSVYGSNSSVTRTAQQPASEQLISAKRTSPANPSNPPFKKPRIGASPLQGRSKSDAISVDDSQEHEEAKDDDVQFTPNAKAKPTTKLSEPSPQDLATGARSSSRQQGLNGYLKSHTDEGDLVELPTSSGRRQVPQVQKKQSVVDLEDYANDSDEELEAVEFTRKAADRRRSGADSSSPVREESNKQTRIDRSDAHSHAHAERIPNTARRKGLTPNKLSVRADGSQSPDVLQQGTTTQTEPAAQAKTQSKSRTLTDRNGLLASQIVGNPNSTRITRLPKPKESLRHAELFRFELVDVICSFLDLPESVLRTVCFFVDTDRSQYYFDLKDPLLESSPRGTSRDYLSRPYPLKNITRMHFGTSSSKLILHLSNIEGRPVGPIALDLGSNKKVYELTQTILDGDRSVAVNHADDEKMEKWYITTAKNAAEAARIRETNASHNYIQSRRSHVLPPQQLVETESSKQRLKAVERLGKPSAKARTVITGKDRRLASRGSSDETAEVTDLSRTATVPNVRSSGFTSDYFGERATRSTRLGPAIERRKPRSLSPPKEKFSETGGLGDPWEQPLTYPKQGKKRENVGFGDLWRLDNDEFLNDTLIGFFLRYLQHRTEVERPEALHKMHFFNSYFFDTLNKGTKSVKSINYEAVHRWTRAVNLFARDFVIVPVNENLHWYVAIICNLPYFKRGRSDEEAAEGIEEDEPSAVTIEDEDENAGDQGQRTKETQQSFEELTIEEKERPSSSTVAPGSQPNGSTLKAGRGRKKKQRRSLPKYDTKKPIIITLDSLGIPRSGVCSSLKQYIVREAKDKQDIDLTDADIRGMTAKEIPTQGNYSDCGLYMCMYLEQFMCDPSGFVEKLLQREEKKIRWPNHIQSEELRKRMRDLIMDLHREQEGKVEKANEPKLGEILVDMRGPSPERDLEIVEESPSSPSIPPRPTTSEGIRAQKQRFSNHFKRQAQVDSKDEDGFEPEADERPLSSSSQRHLEKAHAVINRSLSPNKQNTIVIDDDGSPVKKKKRVSSPGSWNHRDPKELAENLKRARGSSPAQTNPLQNERVHRSRSVDTDFLSGIQSYADKHGDDTELPLPEKSPRRGTPKRPPLKEIELPEEVPETQEIPDEDDSEENDDQDLSVEELKPAAKEDGDRAAEDEFLV